MKSVSQVGEHLLCQWNLFRLKDSGPFLSVPVVEQCANLAAIFRQRLGEALHVGDDGCLVSLVGFEVALTV